MRIAIVNDGTVAREAIARVITQAPGLQLAWTAGDGLSAIERCRMDLPDLLLMDLIMPGMNGVEATRRIMAETPCAILLVTATVEGHASKVFEALGAGALDVVKTPAVGPDGLGAGAASLLAKIDLLGRLVTGKTRSPNENGKWRTSSRGLVAIGTSAGGPAALAAILAKLPKDFPAAIVVVQHVDAHFAPLMSQWLHAQSALPVRLAEDGDVPRPGEVLLAGTNDHLVFINRKELAYTPDPRGEPYRPSVNVFFASVARHWRGRVVAVLLTGMGRDGAKGLKALRESGAHTIAQDQASCVVYGMPKAAVALGAAVEVLPLDNVAARLVSLFAESSSHE